MSAGSTCPQVESVYVLGQRIMNVFGRLDANMRSASGEAERGKIFGEYLTYAIMK